MEKETTGFWERIFIRIKNFVDKLLYYDNLFDDNVWHIRFSKGNKKKIKYKIEKSQFSLSLKTSDDVFKYLWMLLMAAALVWMLVLSQQIGISDGKWRSMSILNCFTTISTILGTPTPIRATLTHTRRHKSLTCSHIRSQNH